ncbi:MAG: MASE3 domain-containing protein [Armatimonadota bacterium]|nr:MASE3 domain-containing protein [Armatimonadota bacterium]
MLPSNFEHPDLRSEPTDSARDSKPCGRQCAAYVVSAAVLMLLGYLADVQGFVIPARWFLPAHIVLEMTSVVVALAVFITGWFGYKQTRSAQDLVVASTFATAGAVDFIHTLTYKGMPNFLGVNSPGKAAAYWLLARLIVGVGLLAAVVMRAPAKERRYLPVGLLASAVAVILGSCVLLTRYGDVVGTALYPAIGRPPSTLKVLIEWVVVVVYAGVLALLERQDKWEPEVKRNLRAALILAIIAEIAFMLYLSPYAWTNALGHVFKVAAYMLILNALFVSAIRRPYLELARARDEMAQLYKDAREHRAEMERSFAQVGKALSSSLKLQEALDLIADLAQQMQHADCAVVVVKEQASREAAVASQRGVCHRLENPVDLTVKLAEQALEKRSSIVIDDLEQMGLVDCDFTHETCLRSAICAPMMYDGEVLGAIAIYSYRKFGFEEWDVRLLEGFASHAAVAIHNALSYQRESTIADILQRTFMSESELTTDKFEITQVYQPATNEALVGGDFYDAFEMSDGRTALVIGDVSGKGLRAAVHTAMIKYTLRAYLNEGHSPSAALRLLNKAASQLSDDAAFVTLFVGVLDPSGAQLTYASAGHEPAIYIHGETRLSLPATGIPLGIDADADYEEGRMTLELGSVLLLYTDGISEARSGKRLLGAEGIEQQLSKCESQTSEDVAKCVHRMAVEFAGGELKDDAAILAVRRIA